MYASKLFSAGGRDDAAYWFEIFLSDMQKLNGFKILSVTSFYEPSGYDKGLNIFVCYEYNEREEENKNES